MGDRRYAYRVEWSHEDDEYVGLVAEFPSLSWLAPTAAEAIAGIEQLVDDVVEDLIADGDPVPAALAERRYSGKIALRISPTLHRRLTIGAAEQQLSLNQWIGQLLAEGSAESASVSAVVEAAQAAAADAMRGLTEAADACSLIADKMVDVSQRLISSRVRLLARLSPFNPPTSPFNSFKHTISTDFDLSVTDGFKDSPGFNYLQLRQGLDVPVNESDLRRGDGLVVREADVDQWPEDARRLLEELRNTLSKHRREEAANESAVTFYGR